ncbi:MAG: hypothetical protein QOH79_2091, partial [Acidimicrobiaceae bacterium]
NDGERKAAFRWDSTEPGEASLVSLEFGFNRRSKGPDLRPRLILLTADAPTPPNYTPCDPGTAAPLIDDVRIDNSYIDGGENVFTKNEITVSWHTDVMSDSLVLYREKGTTNWLQVGTYGRTKQHQVRIRNIDTTKHYEFGVRSTSCNGKATTNDNGGKGYDLFRPPPGDLGPPTDSPTFTFESGTENWTATREGTNPTPPDTNWARSSPGDNSSFAWFAEPYGDLQQAHLTSPPITIPGTVAKYVFRERHDLEKPIPDATTTADALRAEYSVDDGATWTVLALYQEQNASYPNYDTRETPAFSVPNHTFRIRFTVNSDDNISTPPYQGVRVDNVTPRSFTPPGNPFDPFITGIGPVTPKSAGASGLDLKSVVAHRPTAAELTAGTGMCTGRKPSSAQ